MIYLSASTSFFRSFFILATIAFFSPAFAIPVLPGLYGFGVDTAAGRGGKVYRVSNLADSGAGSLRECIDGTGARVCVFEVSGTIHLKSNLEIKSPFITVAGQTSPGYGVLIRGAGIRISASDVLLQHLRIRVGDSVDGPPFDNRDALLVESGTSIRNIVIVNCSFSWATDEVVSAYWGFDGVTFYRNIISEALHDSYHPKGMHGMGFIVGAERAGSISIIENLFAHNVYRNPLLRASKVLLSKNVVYNSGWYATNIDGASHAQDAAIVNNFYISGPAEFASKDGEIGIGTNVPVMTGSSIYIKDNKGKRFGVDDSSGVVFGNNQTRSVLTTRPSQELAQFIGTPEDSSTIELRITSTAGAFPAFRDTVDSRVVEETLNRSGLIKNCVDSDGSSRCSSNGGGWPSLPTIVRPLQIPSDPHADDNGNGYTNLEEWLHKYSQIVEGSFSARPNPPALVVE